MWEDAEEIPGCIAEGFPKSGILAAVDVDGAEALPRDGQGGNRAAEIHEGRTAAHGIRVNSNLNGGFAAKCRVRVERLEGVVFDPVNIVDGDTGHGGGTGFRQPAGKENGGRIAPRSGGLSVCFPFRLIGNLVRKAHGDGRAGGAIRFGGRIHGNSGNATGESKNGNNDGEHQAGSSAKFHRVQDTVSG